MKSSYHTMWHFFENNQRAYQQALQSLLEIKDGEQVTIWTSENESEQIALRISCYLLRDNKVELNCVNTFDAMIDYTKNEDVRIDIRHTGDCNAEQLVHFYKYSMYPVPKEMKSYYAEDGERLLNSNSLVRTWQGGKIVDDKETRDDSFILECAMRIHNEMSKLKFVNATRVIGAVLGHSDQALSDGTRLNCDII